MLELHQILDRINAEGPVDGNMGHLRAIANDSGKRVLHRAHHAPGSQPALTT
jgi:hypothetical protein